MLSVCIFSVRSVCGWRKYFNMLLATDVSLSHLPKNGANKQQDFFVLLGDGYRPGARRELLGPIEESGSRDGVDNSHPSRHLPQH